MNPQIEQEVNKIRSAKARQSLIDFAKLVKPNYLVTRFNQYLAWRLEKFIQDVADGKDPFLIINMEPRAGKKLADSTPVLTTQGWKTHGELVVGDYVYNPQGKAVKILAVSKKSVVDCKLTFSNGEQIIAHENHEWKFLVRNKWNQQIVETKELFKGLKYSLKSGKKGSRYKVDFTKPLINEEKDLLIHPYLLGVWLGNGSASSTCITHDIKDQEPINKIVSLGYKISSVGVHNTTGVIATRFAGRFWQELKALNLINNKHIPDIYLNGSIKQRLELLAGLIDTDGSVDKTGRVGFSNTNLNIINNIITLASSFGWRTCLTSEYPKLSKSGIQGKQMIYKVSFNPREIIPTVVKRKKIIKINSKFNRIAVSNIERCKPELGQCIQVEEGLYLVGKTLISTHNSELTSRLLPAWTLGRHPDWEIIVASYGSSLSSDFIKDASSYIKSDNYPFQSIIKFGEDRSVDFELEQGGKYFGTGVGGPVTGKGGNIIILDDLFKNWKDAESEHQRNVVWEWYLSTLRTRKAPGKAGILAVSTRWHEDDLIGRLITQSIVNPDGDQPEVIKFPAIAEDDEYLDGPAGKFLFRSKGEVLQPERKTLKEVLKDKANSISGIWEAVYQQDPTPPQGYIIQEEWFEDFTMTEIPHDLPVYSYSDTAYGVGRDNSVTIYGFIYNYCAYICHVEVGDYEIDDFLTINYEELAKTPRNQLLIGCENPAPFCDYRAYHLIEPKASGRSCIQLAQKYNVGADTTPELSDSKVVRVKSCTGVLKARRIKLLKNASWKSQFVERCKKFNENAKHKDEADALAGFIRNFLTDNVGERELHTASVYNNFNPGGFYTDINKSSFYE